MPVVHCKREAFDVYIGRPSKWGNPFSHRPSSEAEVKVDTRDEAIESYYQWIRGGQRSAHKRLQLERPTQKEIEQELAGKVLGCWCSPEACHGDVLADLANPDRRDPITRFRGAYRFLSNFWPTDVVVADGTTLPSAEHAYVWYKCEEPADRMLVALTPRASEVKLLGRKVRVRSDWEKVKARVMRDVVQDKFHRNAELAERLRATGKRDLIEGNTWGDVFWGVCQGQGRNELGKILMEVRGRVKGL